MRQFFILCGILTCSFALADHEGSRYSNYNGRNFSCLSFTIFKEEAENSQDGRDHTIFARCQLHRGHWLPGISTLKQAARMGDHAAASHLADYYSSEGI